MWLIKIQERGKSTFNINGRRKRALYISGNVDNGNLAFIFSLSDNDSLMYRGGRERRGEVLKSCSTDNNNGYQYVAVFGNEIYKLSVIPGTGMAVLEEVI